MGSTRRTGPSMSAFARRSRGALAALLLSGAAAAEAPDRVVSINACTDQLAMMLAAPGQLISVTHLAADPRVSAMPEAGARLPHNHGRAEEVYLMDPDLVVGGVWTTPATVAMLEGLGIEVVLFEPATTLADIEDRLRRMGAALGREEAAEAEIAAFRDALAAFGAPHGDGPRAALYGPNGFTAGRGTLSDEIIEAAGLANVAAEIGMEGAGALPLETLILAAPDLVLTAEPHPGASRSEALLEHPALAALGADGAGRIADSEWACGTPHVLGAIRRLAALREGLD